MDDFSFLDLFWSLLIIYFLVFVLMALFSVLVDLFQDHELSGWAKAGWVILLVVFPLVGLLIYVITRGHGMAERAEAKRRASEKEFASQVKEAAGTGGAAAEIAKAKELHESGAITDAEYEALKAKALA